MAFVIDTKGQQELLTEKSGTVSSEDESDDDLQFVPFSNNTLKSTQARSSKLSGKTLDLDLDDTYLDFGDGGSSKRKILKTSLKSSSRRLSAPDKILEKSVLQPGVEQLHTLPTYDEGRRQSLKQRKLERERTKGKKWFNMPAPQVTEEMKNDLEVLQMRSALDPKHFYKKNDLKVLPKYFQIGRIQESAADFYHSRVPKKDRKKTLVDELLADAEFQKTTKKKYKEIIAERQKTHFKAHRQAQRLKKRKK